MSSYINDYVIARIRTFVPIAVGAVVAWLATKWGVVIDAETSAAGVSFIAGLAGAVWYQLGSWLATKFSWAGWLLGYPAAPGYGSESA
jgi:hypothetical protein